MTTPRLATAADLVSIPELARRKGVPYSTLWRDLVTLHRADERQGLGGWLFDRGRGRKKLVNLSRLRAAHPALFCARHVSREEHDELVLRVERCEQSSRDQKQRINAVAASVRDLRRERIPA